MPVVVDHQSRALVSIFTDRDLCCCMLAHGLDPTSTHIQEFVTYNPAICRNGENVEQRECLMQEHQVRRFLPWLNRENRGIGIVVQADLALKYNPERVHKTVAEISTNTRPSSVGGLNWVQHGGRSAQY
jgi:signal-transduction protein with cAMP-binding, CBS, and nucleotidyltransferase domain